MPHLISLAACLTRLLERLLSKSQYLQKASNYERARKATTSAQRTIKRSA